jgi:hypothetical protein
MITDTRTGYRQNSRVPPKLAEVIDPHRMIAQNILCFFYYLLVLWLLRKLIDELDDRFWPIGMIGLIQY